MRFNISFILYTKKISSNYRKKLYKYCYKIKLFKKLILINYYRYQLFVLDDSGKVLTESFFEESRIVLLSV